LLANLEPVVRALIDQKKTIVRAHHQFLGRYFQPFDLESEEGGVLQPGHLLARGYLTSRLEQPEKLLW